MSEFEDVSSRITCRFSYETILQKRLDLLKRYEGHLRHSTDIRLKLQSIHDEIQHKQTMKIPDIDALKSQLGRYLTEFRAIQQESNLLDRLMEESHTTITDTATSRNIFFGVESRTVENLLDTIENKVRCEKRSSKERFSYSSSLLNDEFKPKN